MGRIARTEGEDEGEGIAEVWSVEGEGAVAKTNRIIMGDEVGINKATE